jgi:hypothetical protein
MLSDIACINNSRAGCISIKLSWWLELKDQDGDATCEDAGDDIKHRKLLIFLWMWAFSFKD